MTQVLSLAMALRGGYKNTQTEIDNEIWVNTLRLAVMPGMIGDFVGPLPDHWTVAHDTITDSDTGWTAESAWRLEGGAVDFDPVSYLVDQVLTPVFAWMALTGRSDKAILHEVALYPVDTTGHAIGPAGYGAPTPAVLSFDAGYEPAGGSSGNIAPLQTACVCSHRTPYAGRKGRGRMFLGGLVQTAVDSQGQFTATFMDAALAKQVTFLQDITLAGGDVSVVPALIPDFTQFALITEVRVGSVPDTQRRRRAQLAETFVNDTVR